MTAHYRGMTALEQTSARPSEAIERRPLNTRGRYGTLALSRRLAGAGITPNMISLTSMVFALFAGLMLILGSAIDHSWLRVLCLVFAVVGIQLRLLCNLLDGMVAVECKRQTRSGDLYNELPDRLSDIIIFVAAGCSLSLLDSYQHSGMALGWVVAVCAVLIAYLRVLGVSCGTPQYFQGPMAKPQRMALLSAATLLYALEVYLQRAPIVFYLAMVVLIIGMLVTFYRRTRRILAYLEAQADNKQGRW